MDERLNLEGLRYAKAVAEAASFTAAARAHGVTQPALSTGIARLEERLGSRLFDRSPRGATPTPEGAALLPLISRAVTDIDAVIATARRLSGHGAPAEVRLGVSPLINPGLVARAFTALRELDSNRGLVLREANLDDLRDALVAGDLDLILVPSVLPFPRFEHRIIDSEPMVIVDTAIAANHPGEPVELSTVAAREFILVPDACGLTRFTKDLLDEQGRPMRVYPGEATSYSVLENWANLGLGAAVLPLSRLAAGAPQHLLVDRGEQIEIFYAAIWSPTSALADDLAEIASLLSATKP